MRLLFALAAASFAPPETRYQIDLSQAASRTLTVTVDTSCRASDCDFQLPVWNATYQVRDFAQYVTGFQASDPAGRPLPSRLLTPSSWRVTATPGARLRLRYRYLADGVSPFGCSASDRHVFLNFAQILLYPAGRLREPMSVGFLNVPAGWKTALELPEQEGLFHARHYDELADAPAELSPFAEAHFTLAGKRLRVVVDADPADYDLNRLKTTTEKIAAAATHIMQEAPFPSYTFFYHFRPGGGGGMEHANSTAIDARAPCRDCDLAGVTAHEFFHLWNVKRIRPASMEPIDYTREDITPSLWFAEGVTSTYGSYILLAAGLETPKRFLERLQDQITRYESLAARLEQSAEEASIAAWMERYPGYRRPSRSVSYYLKGELIGYALDLTIRQASGNRRSLDDVMRRLNLDYAQKGRFFEDTTALERLASEAAGRDLRDFFDRMVRRADPVDWNLYLGYAGYGVLPQVTTAPSLGLETGRAPGQALAVSELEPGGPADKAGLRSGDRLVSLNRRPVERNLAAALEALNLEPGASVSLEVERRGQTLSFTLKPAQVRRTSYRIEEIPNATAAQRGIASAWLRAKPSGRVTEPRP